MGDLPVPEPAGARRVDPRSVLAAIAKERDELDRATRLTLAVPRWGEDGRPPILVEFRPLRNEEVDRAMGRLEEATRRKRASGDLSVDLNADLLIAACEAVWVEIDKRRYSMRLDDPEGEPTRFDDDLALTLGFSEAEVAGGGVTARKVVRRLYVTDGDVLAASTELVRWSSQESRQAEDGLSGE